MKEGLEIVVLSITAMYAIFLCTVFIVFMSAKRTKRAVPTEKTMAVVVAVRNESGNVLQLLNALDRQDTPGEFEVIVVDDHSDDDGKTWNELNSFSPMRYQLRTLRATTDGKKAALTQGIAATTAEIILVTDGDCIPGTGWIRSYRQLFANEKLEFAAGLVQYLDGGILRHAMQTEMLFLQVASAGMYELGLASMCNGANMAFTKKFFEAVDGFSGNPFASGDDVLLLHKAMKRNRKSVGWNYSRPGIVRTRPADTLNDAIQQRRRWLSKFGGYGFTMLSVAGLFFLLVQLLLPSALIALGVTGSVMNPFAYGFAIKTLVELLFLSLAAPQFGEYKVIPVFPLSVILYDIIALGAVFILPGKTMKWKGRTLSRGKMV